MNIINLLDLTILGLFACIVVFVLFEKLAGNIK